MFFSCTLWPRSLNDSRDLVTVCADLEMPTLQINVLNFQRHLSRFQGSALSALTYVLLRTLRIRGPFDSRHNLERAQHL